MAFHAPRITQSNDPTPDTREREWVARIRAGDETAFEALFTAYFPPLCDFVRSYVHAPDTAQELVQNVFLRLWQQRAEWQPESVRAYLFAACRNRALMHRRHEGIVARFEDRLGQGDLSAATAAPPIQPDEQLQATELADALHRAIHELPERRRMIMILRWEHQLPHAEIAKVLGISVRTVEGQFARGLAALRTRLAQFRR